MRIVALMIAALSSLVYADKPAPKLELSPVTVTSDYPIASVSSVLDRAKPALIACYATGRAKHPDLSGTMQLYFHITAAGAVIDTTAGGFDEVVQSCIVSVVAKLAFAKPAKPPITIEYALQFGAGQHGVPPNLNLGLPDISNDYPSKSVSDVVGRAKAALFACYTARLANSPHLAGYVTVDFVIAADGSAARHGRDMARSSDHDLDACVSAIVAKLAFAKPTKAPVEVLYSLEFGNGVEPTPDRPASATTPDPEATMGVGDAMGHGGLGLGSGSAKPKR